MKEKIFIINHRFDKINKCMKIPLFVHIEITTRCNVGCPQCYCSSTLNGKDMEIDLYKIIIDEIKEIQVPCILITGGEPLIHPQLFEMIKYATEKNISVIISTSGVNIDDEICKKLLTSNISEVCVSLNGSNEYIHSLSRGSYSSTVNAIKLLSKNKINFRINWVARKDNYMDFHNLIDLCVKNEVENITILSNKKKNGKLYSQLNDNEIILLSHMIEKEKNRIKISIDPCFKELNKMNKSHSLFYNCSAGITFIDILVNGEMTPCRHTTFYPLSYNPFNLKFFWNSNELQIYRNSKDHYNKSCM